MQRVIGLLHHLPSYTGSQPIIIVTTTLILFNTAVSLTMSLTASNNDTHVSYLSGSTVDQPSNGEYKCFECSWKASVGPSK